MNVEGFLEGVGVVVMAVVLSCVLLVAVAIPVSCIDARIPDATTIQHDGHRYVRFKNKHGVIHDPDCPCRNAEQEATR